MENPKNPYLDFFELGFQVAKGSIQAAIQSYERLRILILIYYLVVLFTIFVGWLINIYWEKQIVHILVISSILLSYGFFLLARNSAPISLSILLFTTGQKSSNNLEPWWSRMINSFFLVVSSLIYSGIWPLLILTYLNFKSSPEAFWSIFMCCIGFGMWSYLFTEKKLIAKYLFVATPERLLHQLSASLLRLGLYFSGVDHALYRAIFFGI